MWRWKFIAFVVVAAPSRLAVRARQPMVPVVGFLSLRANSNIDAFNRGVADIGHVAASNVAIETCSTDGRCSQLVADLVRRNVAVIATSRTPAAAAAKAALAATSSVFSITADSLKVGLVAARMAVCSTRSMRRVCSSR